MKAPNAEFLAAQGWVKSHWRTVAVIEAALIIVLLAALLL